LTVTWGADLQALHAKLLHYSFAQDIGNEFAGLRKFEIWKLGPMRVRRGGLSM
jgi:hypothetical protein